MESLSDLEREILQQLEDGSARKLSHLSQVLLQPEKKILETLDRLLDWGFIIEKNKAIYQWIRPHILLDKQHIMSVFAAKNFQTPYYLHLFSTIDSTNRFLKSLQKDNHLHICCAEKQTQGRGRFGKYWHSPMAENIYCSSRWPLRSANLSGLSLVVGLAVIAMFRELNIDGLQIKWPNDIYWQNKKLAGILIELLENAVVIGIGININSDTLAQPLPDKIWCSLFEITGQTFNRNSIIAQLIVQLESYLHRFFQYGFMDFQSEWQQNDYLFQKSVTINQHLTGIAQGVSNAGELILEDNKGCRHFVDSGEASLS